MTAREDVLARIDRAAPELRAHAVVEASQVRPIRSREITHARELAAR